MSGSKTVKNQLFDQHILSIEEDFSNTISFIGHIKSDLKQGDLSTLKGRDEWRIARVTTNSGQIITEWADGGKFTQVWDNRESIFENIIGPFANTTSTLFDGINDYVDLQDTHQYDNATAFSIGLWVKPQNTSVQRSMFSKAQSTGSILGYNFMHDSSGRLFVQLRATSQLGQHTFTTSTLTSGVFQFVFFTYSGGQNMNGLRAYINAVVGTIPTSFTITNTWLFGQSTSIGARDGNTQFFSGNLDEVTVWTKSFTQAEVTELYNNGVPTDPSLHSAAGGGALVSHYRMGDGDSFPTIVDNKGSANGTMVNMGSEDFVTDVP